MHRAVCSAHGSTRPSSYMAFYQAFVVSYDVNTHCSDVSGVMLSLEPLDPKRVDRDVNRGLGSVHVYQLTEFAVKLGAGNHISLASTACCVSYSTNNGRAIGTNL